MDFLDTLTDLLQSSGGWGLAAVFSVVIWRLVSYIRDQHKERIAEQSTSIKILEGVKGYLTSNEKAFDRFTEKLDRLLEERRT